MEYAVKGSGIMPAKNPSSPKKELLEEVVTYTKIFFSGEGGFWGHKASFKTKKPVRLKNHQES